MGFCTLCGEKAGWFKDVHQECIESLDAGRKELGRIATESALNPAETSTTIAAEFERLRKRHPLSASDAPEAAKWGFEQALEKVLSDNFVTEAEEQALMAYCDRNKIGQDELGPAWMKLGCAVMLREVIQGRIPSTLKVSGNIPFALESDEQLVWVQPAQLMEQRKSRRYEGASAGVSVKVARGVYFRTSSFQGQPIDEYSFAVSDAGTLFITSQYLRFRGELKSLKLPYHKIAAFQPFSDGLGFCRDTMTAKTQIFLGGDGWFLYNLAVNLAQISERGESARA